ncbi:hypothetical protein BGZ83_011508 [Gryganskiella cystojenkinii]|nr:hypothetical protein BGZ83_011508 [Gryganskiella cystojenkinii]
MGVESISTHTIKNDATTTIVARTTTIVSEHEEIIADDKHYHHHNSVVNGVKKTLREYWFPSHGSGTDSDDDDANHADDHHADPTKAKSNSVMRRAYDYWKSLTRDADESAKELVLEAKKLRDEAAHEAKWAMFGYKKEAREAFEAAEQKYKDALAAAEKVHEEAHERARSRWSQQADCTQKEVGEAKEGEGEITHKKWDKFKAAVDSLAFNPPKYACSPSSQYWFGRQNPAADSGWDCREIWDHPSRHDHAHDTLKSIAKKTLPIDKVHGVLAGLLQQAGSKAKSAPSSTGAFDASLKSVKDYYHSILDRVARNEKGALEELDTVSEKLKGKLNQAKYHEEQIDSWLTSQWNAVIDNAGDVKSQYERVFKNALKDIKNSRAEAYNGLISSLQKSVNQARTNVKDALRLSKNDSDRSKVLKAIHDASKSFADSLKEAENKIKAAPKNAYDHAVESFNKETANLKTKLEHAAEAARKSGSSISHQVSKSASSVARQATDSGKGLREDASRKLHEAKKSADSIRHRASSKYDKATASVNAIWGAATPFAKVQDSYQQLLGDATSNLFGQHNTGHGHHDVNSFYGALTALYLLFLARKIWLGRKCCRRGGAAGCTHTHGNLHVTKQGRRHSLGSSSSHEHHDNHDHDEHHHEHHEHDHHGKHSHHEDTHRHDYSHGLLTRSGHHNNSFNAVLSKFTSVVPMTLLLLVLLELAGFSRIGLHSLFAGLFTSQLLQCGYFNGLMEQLGILDSGLGEAILGRDAREMGSHLAWTTFGLAAAANAIKVSQKVGAVIMISAAKILQ